MKKITGILVLLFIFIQLEVCADTLVNDNFKQNINPKISMQTDTSNNSEYMYAENLTEENGSNQIELNEKVLNYALFPLKPLIHEEQESIIYQENQRSVNAINPKKEGSVNSYYPGLRGPNQLIIYTPSYGLRTGTNEFGTEAIVEKNMVVGLNGADSIIPKNGLVVSGHGSAKNWINKNLQIGSKVYIDYQNKLIKVFLTPESLVFAAKEKIKEVNALVEYYRNLDILYNDKKANACLEESKESLRNAEKKPEKTQAYINDAMSSLDDAIKNAIPYKSNELKGIWLRPVEKSPEQIEKTLERVQSSGITDIFLETYFHGKTIYPSKFLKDCGVTSQREEFVGFDPLEVWIEEAHKRNIKIHVWFESFYVGNDNPQLNPEHVLSVYPSWANKRLLNYESEEPVPSLSEHNGYFLDPANIQVQIYLSGIIEEIITNYKIDGINLDYIRYPQTVDPSYSNYVMTNWGYTKTAREEFKELYGIDPVEITYASTEWDLWCLYRQNQISKFIKNVKDLTNNTNILLTAVIFPDLKKSKTTKMQNWKDWSLNNYIDGFTPLLLTGNQNTAVMLLKEVVNNTSPVTKIYPGLFVTFMGGSFEDLLIQIHKTREFNSKGAVIFDYAHLNDTYIDALNTRIFNKSYDTRDSKGLKNKEFKLREPKDYKPEVKYEKKKQKNKKSRRKNNDND